MRTRVIPERLRGAFTTRRYTNPRLPLPLLVILNINLDILRTYPGQNVRQIFRDISPGHSRICTIHPNISPSENYERTFPSTFSLSQFASRPAELRSPWTPCYIITLRAKCRCYFRRPHCVRQSVSLSVNADNSIPAMSAPLSNIYAKFHRNVSTKYRYIVSRGIVLMDNRRADGWKIRRHVASAVDSSIAEAPTIYIL